MNWLEKVEKIYEIFFWVIWGGALMFSVYLLIFLTFRLI